MESTQSDLSETRIHEVLSNDRRRMVIQLLRENGSLTVRELSERIAAEETGETPPPRNIRQSAYVSLQQTHLPKLDRLDIVNYDEGTKAVRLNTDAGDVAVYMEVVPDGKLSWSEYYAVVSSLGVLLVVASTVGVPVFGAVGASALAVAVFLLIGCSALYQRYSHRWQ